jgi:hypothetical protein
VLRFKGKELQVLLLKLKTQILKLFFRIKRHLPLVIENDALNLNPPAGESTGCRKDALSHFRKQGRVTRVNELKRLPGRVAPADFFREPLVARSV